MKFKVGDLVITNVKVDDAFQNGAIGRITNIDKSDDELPYEVRFISGYIGDDECWAKGEELDTFSPAELAEARETIAAQQIVIDQLRAQLEARQ